MFCLKKQVYTSLNNYAHWLKNNIITYDQNCRKIT